MARLLPLIIALVCLPSCKNDDPADVSGTYTIALTNGANGCNLTNYTVGNTATGISMVVTQTDDAVSAEVQGIAGLALDAFVGAHTFVGTVDGSDVTMRIAGTRMMTMSTCDYHFDAIGEARLTGDSLAGTLTYTAITDQSVDCGTLEGCETIQMFNGSRPPQ